MTNSTSNFIPVSIDTARAHPLYGVKGWLIVFGFSLVLGFMSGWGKLVGMAGKEFGGKEFGFKGNIFDLLWLEGMGVARALFFAELAIVLFILYLMCTKNNKFRLISSAFLVLAYPISLGIAFSELLGRPDGAEIVNQFIVWLLSMAIWVTYLNRSKRVRVTYENMVLNDGTYDLKDSEAAQTTGNTPSFAQPASSFLVSAVSRQSVQAPQTHKPAPTPVTLATTNSEEVWAQALAEFESDKRRAGLWAQAYAEADGNEVVAKARYIKARANALTMEREAILTQAELERQAQLAEQLRLAQLEDQKRQAAMIRELDPKGECPNCKRIIFLDLSCCPKCKATFKTETGEPTNWSIKPLTTL